MHISCLETNEIHRQFNNKKDKQTKIYVAHDSVPLARRRFGSFFGCDPRAEVAVAVEFAAGAIVNLFDRSFCTSGRRRW